MIKTTLKLYFFVFSLDKEYKDGHIAQDILNYIRLRCRSSSLIRQNISMYLSSKVDNLEVEFEDHLERISNGCFLYLKMTLDMIEKGHLVIKSSSFSVLPVSLFEVFLLEFNLKFSSKKSFQKAANVLCLCIASLHPLNLTQIHQHT